MIDETLWLQLEQRHPDETGVVRRRVHSNPGFDIFAAVAQPGARRLVLVALGSDVVLPDLPDTASIQTAHRLAESGRTEIRVTLVNDEMQPVFTPFADDVLVAMSLAHDGQAAADALADRFEHWRNLLAAGSTGLGTSELTGLYGELWALKNLCGPAMGLAPAVSVWTGPDRDRRDVVIGGLGIEVKTTLTAPPATVQIRSELQLDPAPLDDLVLVALELDESAGADGETVPELVEAMSRQLGDSRAELTTKLTRYGYHEVHVEGYASRRFVIRRLGVYAVTDGFPRIVPSALHSGIGAVRYRLSLGACEPWAISTDRLRQLVSGAVSGGVADES